jgi:hypothetical protein
MDRVWMQDSTGGDWVQLVALGLSGGLTPTLQLQSSSFRGGE